MQELRYTVFLPEEKVRALIASWYDSEHRRTGGAMEEDVFLFPGVCASYMWVAETAGCLWIYRRDGAVLPPNIERFVNHAGVRLTDRLVVHGTPEGEFSEQEFEGKFQAAAEASYLRTKKSLEAEVARFHRRRR